MAFRESVLQKIKIDELAGKVLATLGPPGSGKKVNKESMRELLDINGYVYKRERDLDLYIHSEGAGKDAIIVLDNELALYRTTPHDVAMRKSPTVKEMVSIRNAIKILKDSDVVVSRREDTLRTVQQACIEQLDFSFEEADIEAIGADGMTALDNGYVDGVVEMLKLFEEILGYDPLPKPLTVPHCHMAGAPGRKTSGEIAYGPIVIYNMMHNKLKFADGIVSRHDKDNIGHLHAIARGEGDATLEGATILEGAGVFEKLTALFLNSKTKDGGTYRLAST